MSLIALLLLILALLRLTVGLVAQLLLLAHHLIELVQRAAHLLARRIGLLVLGHRQIVERVLQLLQHLLRIGFVAGARHLLHAVEHGLQIFAGDRLGVVGPVLLLLLLRVALLLLLFGELVQIFVHRRAQIFSELANLFVRRIALQGVAQLLFGRAQIAFRIREIAIFDLQRHAPEEIRNGDEIGIALRVLQHARCEIEAEIDRRLGVENLRRDHQRFERILDPLSVFGIKNEIAPLLGDAHARGVSENVSPAE